MTSSVPARWAEDMAVCRVGVRLKSRGVGVRGVEGVPVCGKEVECRSVRTSSQRRTVGVPN